MRVCYLLLLLLFVFACQPSTETTQSESGTLFRGLSTQIEPGKKVVEGQPLVFPADHLAHPDFNIEWWYFTVILQDQQGNSYPFQWTLFRYKTQQSQNTWSNNQQYMGHAKLATMDQQWFAERFARGGVGNAAVTGPNFNAFIDDWVWQSSTADLFPATLKVKLAQQVNISLNLNNDKHYVLHGNDGFSRKSKHSEQASYYYSQPFIQVSGSIELPEGTQQVTGIGWFDHEWSSQYLDSDTLGWDWFSIHLNNGSKLMLFNMRYKNQQNFVTGTLISASGESQYLDAEVIQLAPLSNTSVQNTLLPLQWQIRIPQHDIDIQISPLKADQWNNGLFRYYEGAILVNGSHQGQGFIELTGY